MYYRCDSVNRIVGLGGTIIVRQIVKIILIKKLLTIIISQDIIKPTKRKRNVT